MGYALGVCWGSLRMFEAEANHWTNFFFLKFRPKLINESTMNQMSSNQITGYLLYLGDEILPSDMGIILNHYKNPY